jgi:hypothetical protein
MNSVAAGSVRQHKLAHRLRREYHPGGGGSSPAANAANAANTTATAQGGTLLYPDLVPILRAGCSDKQRQTPHCHPRLTLATPTTSIVTTGTTGTTAIVA